MENQLTLAVLAVIVLREVWDVLKTYLDRDKNHTDKRLEALEKDLKENTAATIQNTTYLKVIADKTVANDQLQKDMVNAILKLNFLEHQVAKISDKIEV